MKQLFTLSLLSFSFAPTNGAPSLSCGTDLCFASGLSSGAVLQQSPASAVLYGSVNKNSPSGSAVTVFLNASDRSTSQIFHGVVATDGTWRVQLSPQSVGGNYSVKATCEACAGVKTATISDLTFGDVFYCGGQSNMWLPLWFTFARNATTIKVLNGSYSNIRLWRGGLGQVSAPGGGSGNWVGPAGPEPGSDSGDALNNQWRHPYDVAFNNEIRPGEPWFWEFPSTCWYTAQFLTDLIGPTAPPMGLMTTPVGGTMLEEWSSPETQKMIKNVTCMCMDDKTCNPYKPLDATCTKNSDLYWGNVQPFVNITIKSWWWCECHFSPRYIC